MKHIREIMERVLQSASKAKFYHTNRDIFLQYFTNPQQYQTLLETGNFEVMEQIIKENSEFSFEEFVRNQS